VIKLVAGNMRIMVPVEFAEKIGLREVVEKEEFKKVFAILKGEKEDMVADWKVRYATNLEKMKTGSVFKMAEVARNLSWRSREKTLSVGEKRLFENACSAIATELAYSWKIEPQEADAMVKNILKEGADQQPTVQ
jgi:CarD family transcriptional regulator